MLKYYLITIAAVSLLAFVLFAVDKVNAKRDGGRIPEIVLLTAATLGGGVGAFLGKVLLRHKSNAKRKPHFAIVIALSALLQVGLLVYLFFV